MFADILSIWTNYLHDRAHVKAAGKLISEIHAQKLQNAWPVDHCESALSEDRRSVFCSAAISTDTLQVGSKEAWPAEPNAISKHTAGASPSCRLPFSSCLTPSLGVCLKGTFGSDIGRSVLPVVSLVHGEMCAGRYDLLASTDMEEWSCLRRCLDCYQVGCWHRRAVAKHVLHHSGQRQYQRFNDVNKSKNCC